MFQNGLRSLLGKGKLLNGLNVNLQKVYLMCHLYVFLLTLTSVFKLRVLFINCRLTNYQKALELDGNKYKPAYLGVYIYTLECKQLYKISYFHTQAEYWAK